MDARPSDPVLAWLRQLIEKRGINTAALAERCQIPRARMRKLLVGAEPMLVDELLRVSTALELSPADMGLPEAAGEPPEAAPTDPAPPPEGPRVDPWGNHPEQLFRVAFGLGCDFFFLAAADQLDDSGVPGQTLAQYRGRELPIKLDAAYHGYNNPRFDDGGITLTLSFDQLYDCRFPWTSIRQFILYPAPPEPGAKPEPTDEAPDEGAKGRPHLRLVT